jgi:GH24 family phage-related lysozyme (muramidase)
MDHDQAESRIAEYEGKRAHVYTDTAGHPTVGIGFNLDRDGAQPTMEAVGANYNEVRAGNHDLTDDQISKLFQQDLNKAIDDAASVVSTFSSLNDPRQFVVVDMIFNLGRPGFSQFHHTIKAIDSGEWEAAGDNMKDSAWYGQVGIRAQKDVQMMKTGEWA